MTHEELREMAAVYALGAHEPGDGAVIEDHLSSCTWCRAEVDTMREVAALLALSVPTADPQRLASLRARVIADATKVRPIVPPFTNRSRASAPSSARNYTTTWLAAASLLLAAVSAGGWLASRRDASRLERALASTADTLASRDSVLSAFIGPMVHVVSLSDGENRKPSARVFWNHTRNEFIVTAFGLPPAPTGMTYQLWALRDGKPPLSMGTFDIDDRGRALAILPVGDIKDGGYIDDCALTLEPAGGSLQPTETPRLVGAWRHVD